MKGGGGRSPPKLRGCGSSLPASDGQNSRSAGGAGCDIKGSGASKENKGSSGLLGTGAHGDMKSHLLDDIDRMDAGESVHVTGDVAMEVGEGHANPLILCGVDMEVGNDLLNSDAKLSCGINDMVISEEMRGISGNNAWVQVGGTCMGASMATGNKGEQCTHGVCCNATENKSDLGDSVETPAATNRVGSQPTKARSRPTFVALPAIDEIGGFLVDENSIRTLRSSRLL